MTMVKVLLLALISINVINAQCSKWIYNPYTRKLDCASASGAVLVGTAVLGTSPISSGACATAVSVLATGALTTDDVSVSFNSDPTGVTGYTPSTSGMLSIIPYPTVDHANFKVCNNTSASITPGAITLNWTMTRTAGVSFPMGSVTEAKFSAGSNVTLTGNCDITSTNSSSPCTIASTGGGGGPGIGTQGWSAVSSTSTTASIDCTSGCTARIGEKTYHNTVLGTATSITGSGAASTIYFYVDSSGNEDFGYDGTAVTGATLSNMTGVTGITGFPANSLPIGSCPWTGSALSACTDQRSVFSRNVIQQGAGTVITQDPTTGLTTVAANASTVGFLGTANTWTNTNLFQNIQSSTTLSTTSPVTVSGTGFYYWNAAGNVVFNLPVIGSSSVGSQLCFRNYFSRTGTITLQSPAATFIDVNGANGSSAGTLVSSGALGDAVCVVSTSTTEYVAYIQRGTWTNN